MKNFRSHASILQYPNECFYEHDLVACGNEDTDAFIGSTLLPNPRYPIIFHAIPGLDQRESTSPSFFNIDEVLQVKSYVEELRRLGAGEDQVSWPNTSRFKSLDSRRRCWNNNSIPWTSAEDKTITGKQRNE